MVRAGVVAILAAFVQAVLAAEAATSGAAPCWIYLLSAGAALTGSVAVNIATAPVGARSCGIGDVPEQARAARRGVHHHHAQGLQAATLDDYENRYSVGPGCLPFARLLIVNLSIIG